MINSDIFLEFFSECNTFPQSILTSTQLHCWMEMKKNVQPVLLTSSFCRYKDVRILGNNVHSEKISASSAVKKVL